MVPSLILWASLASAEEIRPPGETVPNAIAVHVTPQGFDALEDVVAALIPSLIADAGLELDDIDLGGVLTLENIKPIIDVRSVQITPQDGFLDVRARLRISLNDPGDPMHVGGWCDEDGWIGPIDADLRVTIGIDVVTLQGGATGFDVQIDTELGVDIDPPGLFNDGDFHLGICGDIIGGLLGVFQSALVGIIQGPIDDALAGLETTLEDALSGASLSQSIDLLGAELRLDVVPRQFNITTAGVEVLVNLAADADQAVCIASEDPGGSVKTNGAKPALGANPVGTQVALHVADDGVAQILYAVYRSGVLCFTVDENAGLDLPISLDTSLLTLLGGEAYKDIIGPVAKPLIIKTHPYSVPSVVFDGAHDLDAIIDDLGLGFYGELDGRIARLMNVRADINAGVDLNFDGTTGNLGILVDIGEDAIQLRVVDDTLVKGSEAATAEAIQGFVGGLVPQLIGPLLGDLAFAIPAFEGIGLTSLDVYPTGQDADWLTASAAVGAVTYGADGGCGAGGDPAAGGCSCESQSCDTGCSQASVRWSPAIGGLAAVWLLRRRRR